jgi:hypothetical protein
MLESVSHSSTSAPKIIKIIGDKMPPCGTPDTSFIDFEIDVPIFTLWL